jgi:hypothetical protein
MGVIPDGVHKMRYLTDTNAWFVTTDCPDGLKLFNRIGYQSATSGDFETDDFKYRGRTRYRFGWTNWRGIFGSSGVS